MTRSSSWATALATTFSVRRTVETPFGSREFGCNGDTAGDDEVVDDDGDDDGAKAAEGCGTLSQGTNGTREVLIPDPQSSSIPSDLLTTPPSVTDDHRAPLDVVNEDDDCCGNHQATAAWIYRTEGREEDEDGDDDKDSITLENTLVGLTFEAAVFLMVSSFQPRGNSSLLATWSPSWSPSWSMSPPAPPPSLSSSSASLPITMAQVAIVFGLTVSLIARMMLRRGHTTAANVCRYACILSAAVAFFSMTSVFVADPYAWALWVAGGILLLVFSYSIAQR
ncbi:hypothetical protein RHGRI_018252 [Rhododendron griersonianum]|uniref:Uncharacterized protein n=1 Tax=Rhododendron griersonianum TaxID=479676 RepID=A0AAV6K0R8_9ERIC|nr:hypothetical protein RHGRI_018252 [Rhododendron griersonianum]